jgi:hypothetical protein
MGPSSMENRKGVDTPKSDPVTDRIHYRNIGKEN